MRKRDGSVTGTTIDNAAKRYMVIFFNTTADGTTAEAAARIGHKLQVSPAPATASFNDVPTSDPAFQFIEALVASGITAGCGGRNDCPDAPADGGVPGQVAGAPALRAGGAPDSWKPFGVPLRNLGAASSY